MKKIVLLLLFAMNCAAVKHKIRYTQEQKCTKFIWMILSQWNIDPHDNKKYQEYLPKAEELSNAWHEYKKKNHGHLMKDIPFLKIWCKVQNIPKGEKRLGEYKKLFAKSGFYHELWKYDQKYKHKIRCRKIRRRLHRDK